MMVRMPFQFEKQIVSESVRSIPAVPDCHFLILSIWQFFSPQSVVLDVVDGFKIDNREEGFKEEHKGGLSSIEDIDKSYE